MIIQKIFIKKEFKLAEVLIFTPSMH